MWPFDTGVANTIHLNYAVPFYIKKNCICHHLEQCFSVVHNHITLIFYPYSFVFVVFVSCQQFLKD